MSEITRFSATDQDGRTVTIIYSEDEIDPGERGSPGLTVGGLKRLRTIDGVKVNWVSKGVYEVPAMGYLRLTSDDPQAP